jgi:hypothetical protein
LAAPVSIGASGAHHLHYRNMHRRDIGVFLANALMPDDDRVVVRAQRRDSDQHDLIIEYELDERSTIHARWWVLLTVAGVLGAVAIFLGVRRD